MFTGVNNHSATSKLLDQVSGFVPFLIITKNAGELARQRLLNLFRRRAVKLVDEFEYEVFVVIVIEASSDHIICFLTGCCRDPSTDINIRATAFDKIVRLEGFELCFTKRNAWRCRWDFEH